MLESLIGQRINLPGHFEGIVTLEHARPIGGSFECRVRLADGTLEETVLSADEASRVLESAGAAPVAAARSYVDADHLRLLVESSRIRLAYSYDPQFAVSLSGIRTLPHQVEAVYQKMLPQPRLRFLLADDPGAGKTIMAGVLIKEMKLREAVDRILILCPAPLTIQWQEELLRWFDEPFDIVNAAVDQQQLVDPWQRSSQIVASMDYAKQDDVRERVWSQRWDLVIIDEAHKCSAYTKSSAGRNSEVEETKRYQIAKRLSATADHFLLLTATPHHGDEDRFAHFVRLIDPDLFPEPHRLGTQAYEIRKSVFQLGENCPWALRRLKEDLRDLNGRRLFPDRHAHTVPFALSREEYALYKAVTAYINQFIPQQTGQRRSSAALARTVLQRRLASSTAAIFQSLKRRYDRQRLLVDELEMLTPAQQSRRLAQLAGRLRDAEIDEDDLDDNERDSLFDEFSTAGRLDELRSEVNVLRDLVDQARDLCERGADSKLRALHACLEDVNFGELRDGRGKLLVFTEHRDTLRAVKAEMEGAGYKTCEIYGGMNPHERKAAQEMFRTDAQVCVATEAAGEGINLQFCHLMINYDLPWNPTRLEQRLGRIHRIGQVRDVHAFNFVATESVDGQPVIEGAILARLLSKLEQMRAALNDRVFDVIGEILTHNDVNLAEMLRDVAYDPRRLDEYIDQIDRIDPERLRQYEEATGIALARGNVDFTGFQARNHAAEERRLMPRYVEEQFVGAAREVGLRVDPRADGLLRVEHVPADLRSDRLAATRKYGKPEASYRKITFEKSDLQRDQHLDAVLLGPSHPLYAVVDERLRDKLHHALGGVAIYIDPTADSPYKLHFFEIHVHGRTTRGEDAPLHGELVAVRESIPDHPGALPRMEIVPSDVLMNLPAYTGPGIDLGDMGSAAAADYLKGGYQLECRAEAQRERERFANVCREYLEASFEARIRRAQDRHMDLLARERESADFALAARQAEQEYNDLLRSRDDRFRGLSRLQIVRTGPVRHVGTAIVLNADVATADQDAIRAAFGGDAAARSNAEIAAENYVIKHLVDHEGFAEVDCERVGNVRFAGNTREGFDIRAVRTIDRATGEMEVRRIEVKGRQRGGSIVLTTNEWFKAQQLRDSYWLYVVWDPTGLNPDLIRIQNPAARLDHAKREVIAARYFEIDADAITEAGLKLA